MRNESAVAFRETTPDGENFPNGHCHFSQRDDIILVLPEKYTSLTPISQEIYRACEMSGWGKANIVW
jgi:hypothetical protein